MTIAVPKRDVKTTLNYWSPVPGNKHETDFRKPGAEQSYDERQNNKIPTSVTIHDVRGHEPDFTLEENGFQYVPDQAPDFSHCNSEEEIAAILVPHTEKLVQELLGATKTHVFTHRVRSKATDSNKRADSRAPALSIHSDFTAVGAKHQLEQVIQDPAEREAFQKGRVYAINVWRPLKTVFRDPLAVCDWSSVDAKKDWIAERFIFPNSWNELGEISHNPDHRWYYLNQQTPNEPLVFVQYDSKKEAEGGMTTAHSAFVDPEYQDGEARESIEIKMFAFVPEA